MLTTVDNPYNPYTDYDKWYQWDVQYGYNSASYLARVVGYYNPNLPPNIVNQFIEDAILSIVSNDLTGTYAKISEKDATPLVEEAYKDTIARLK